jgi:hypothetical protein
MAGFDKFKFRKWHTIAGAYGGEPFDRFIADFCDVICLGGKCHRRGGLAHRENDKPSLWRLRKIARKTAGRLSCINRRFKNRTEI